MSAIDLTCETVDITADAVALQERDEFRSTGWLKVIAPAKVNLHLAIGARRDDGYHEVETVLHALTLHDTLYIRRKNLAPSVDAADACSPTSQPPVRMVSMGDVIAPALAPEDNLAWRAARALAAKLGRAADLEIRIEKNIPAQAGLGGGSTDAAGVLVGAAHLWGLPLDDPRLEQVAHELGSDVAFFLRGGCALYDGAGERFVQALEPSKQAVALVKPAFGISTAAAYRTFDEEPVAARAPLAASVDKARAARDVTPFNNLAPAAERLEPELADLRAWLSDQPGVAEALLCGSGSCTFALCEDFQVACRLVADARRKGLWARATSLGSIRAMPMSQREDAMGGEAGSAHIDGARAGAEAGRSPSPCGSTKEAL